MMRNLKALLLVLSVLTATVAHGTQVPSRMNFAGIQLELDQGARSKIKTRIDNMKKSPSQFAKLETRARLFLPLVEQGFRQAGVPKDLMYMVIQESSLNGNATGQNGAIGYWQMKIPAAREAGLRVDQSVDERRHIYRSSYGAATYFKQINRKFDNWVYALIGYNRGPAGALKYVNQRYYGASKMKVTGNIHSYVIKAIAFKLMFEPAMKNMVTGTHLYLMDCGSARTTKELARKADMPEEKFIGLNPWIRGKKLPSGNFQCVALGTGGRNTTVKRPAMKPKPVKLNPKKKGVFMWLGASDDPDYGREYVHLQSGEQLVDVAVRHHIKVRKLRQYNEIGDGRKLEAGKVIYLQKQNKRRYAIAEAGDTWNAVARRYDRELADLYRLNRTEELGEDLYAGQKVYLKQRKPKAEKILVLEQPGQEIKTVDTEPTINPDKRIPVAVAKPGRTHTVKRGDTLWSISQKYKTTVAELKRSNGLVSNDLRIGQVLKIPQK